MAKSSMPRQSSTADVDWSLVSDHAWRYFELHANQRMAVFNFFTVLSGAVVAGIAATQGAPRFGVALGLALTILSFIFWKLDQRAAFLIKHADEVHVIAEAQLCPTATRLFTLEPAKQGTAHAHQNILQRPWTFGRSFRTTFFVMGLIGVGSTILSAFGF